MENSKNNNHSGASTDDKYTAEQISNVKKNIEDCRSKIRSKIDEFETRLSNMDNGCDSCDNNNLPSLGIEYIGFLKRLEGY